jgi:DNA-binding NtrC family response regulator
VGSEAVLQVDVRVVAATNRDLEEDVQAGRFREDLFYRLNVIPIQIPPLRERKNDIPLLANHFLDQVADRSGHPAPKMSEPALAAMMDYAWPGNVRELQNAVQFAIVKCNKKIILPRDLPLELAQSDSDPHRRGPARKLETPSVRQALAKAGGNKAKAARLLGVGRATLYRFLNDHPEAVAPE